MSGLGYTPAEPIRDDEPAWDADELVTCPNCDGLKTVRIDRADGALVKRACRVCKSTPGQVLRGNPPESPYEMTVDVCVGAFPCCGKGPSQ